MMPRVVIVALAVLTLPGSCTGEMWPTKSPPVYTQSSPSDADTPGDSFAPGDADMAGDCQPAGDADAPGDPDDAGDARPGDGSDGDASNGCQAVATPDHTPLAGELPPGLTESVELNVGSWWDPEIFHDDYVYNSAGTVKLGTRREYGGSIVFFGLTDNANSNTIDANDTGREVQVAFYDHSRASQNCAWNAGCGQSDCPKSITYLGWNPVQGGNRCDNGSGVDSMEVGNGALTATVTPLFWNPNWDRTDCSTEACSNSSLSVRRSDVEVVQRVRFVRPNIAELEYTLVNLSDLDHPVTAHEMPTVYTANGQGGPDLWRLFNSQGAEIAINQPANDGFFWKPFDSPGGWATLQNDNLSYGVGLYSENRPTTYQGWQNRALPFNNFRPVLSFAIPPFGMVRARAYLILGSLATVQAEAQWLDTNLPPFGSLDQPAAESVVGDSIQIAGWALDNRSISSVRAHLDGIDLGPLARGGSRPDVCSVWFGYAGCATSGFNGVVEIPTLSACGHIIEIVANDSDGNERIIARTRVFDSE